MQRFVHVIVGAYWCAAFAMLALSPGTMLGEGFLVPLNDFERGIADTPLASWPGVAALVVTSTAVLIAALFLWTVLSAAFDDLDDMRWIAAISFASGALMAAALLVLAFFSVEWVVSASWLAPQAVALLVSWLALGNDRAKGMSRSGAAGEAPGHSMARQAARELMLARFSRPLVEPREEIGG